MFSELLFQRCCSFAGCGRRSKNHIESHHQVWKSDLESFGSDPMQTCLPKYLYSMLVFYACRKQTMQSMCVKMISKCGALVVVVNWTRYKWRFLRTLSSIRRWKRNMIAMIMIPWIWWDSLYSHQLCSCISCYNFKLFFFKGRRSCNDRQRLLWWFWEGNETQGWVSLSKKFMIYLLLNRIALNRALLRG